MAPKGNEQYRKEMSDGERVTGSYGYLGPDGLYRHVEYVADENGFRAKIRTSEPGTANDNPSNVQIESNPVQVVSNPTPYAGPPSAPPGSAYNNPIGGGVRREDTIRPQNIPTVNVNPNRSTYGTRQLDQLPRTPEPSRASNPAPDVNRDRVNINRGPDSSRSVNPSYESKVRDGSTGDNRGGRVGGDRVPYADIPDNIMPYRGANPQRPKETPRVVGPQNEFIDQNVPKFGSNPDINDQRNPGYSRNGVNPRLPEPQSFIGATDPPYETNFDRSGRDRDRDMNPIFDDNRDPPIGGYEVTTKGGSTKGPPKHYGFIEATKGINTTTSAEDKIATKGFP
ncbi:unnamed protein product [Medioppia subpectinata]|uniref:Cuticle protein n=1 Tax=Medioppia subpectinata TaxID=1979941 RepID=A0A7R9LUA5_9ACAR|nr:unnamed protein product [Medioppia subpectinata]CAG2121105.1 unnamed protein product [Medioppia subpectinata]